MGFFNRKKNSVSSHGKKNYPKCNCDGCNRQETCKYGHIIYDDFDHSRLSLVDKFIMLYAFDSKRFEPKGNYSDIATSEERHNRNKLLKLDRNVLVKTLDYLQEEKKLYLDVGKCGKAYYNDMNMGGEMQLVKDSIKLMDEVEEMEEEFEAKKKEWLGL